MKLVVLCLISAALAFSPAPASSRRRIALSSTASNVEIARQNIIDSLAPLELVVTTADDDPNGAHVSISVVSAAFESLPKVKRQQLVYRCLKDLMATNAIHAVDSLVTIAPSEQ
ncbi:hypothetical protein M885DRAFT_505689 [Pelagophyceae sp. CCMP2097]|nr:hypothetical protein M885DRAFT_505689 [Pelagophyceae sp. CCMP2097]|mmetsp:Transcript_15542/g.52399  ORF Transcript_15542/g.52399 Transcript_15542/m.52399 type:complete len:114 (+) Transcript_15542:34-375(+)